ncbi:MAG: hypothetical protein ORN98_09665, partial [Alphaproteobacteria bacterium]|nr:hypothetical protein [Alphaproteobacteria bacterium]
MSAAPCRRDQTNWPKPAKTCGRHGLQRSVATLGIPRKTAARLRGRGDCLGFKRLIQTFNKEGLN